MHVSKSTPPIVIGIPAFAMSQTLTQPVEYAIADGGVPIGTMKSSDVPIPAKIASCFTPVPVAPASGMTIGTRSAAVAVFEALSVVMTAKYLLLEVR